MEIEINLKKEFRRVEEKSLKGEKIITVML